VEEVGPQRVLEIRRVQEAVLPEEPCRLVGDLVQGRAISHRPLAGDALQDVRGLHEDLLLLVAGAPLERFVEGAVMADLVAPAVDLGHDVGVPLGRQPRTKNVARRPFRSRNSRIIGTPTLGP